MANQEAIEMPWDTKQTIENLKILKKCLEEFVTQRNFEGRGKQDAAEIAFDIDRAIAALEKQEPMGVVLIGDGYADGKPAYDFWECPGCGEQFEIDDKHNFCPKCGQALNWEQDEQL